jgi:hypothetical protein
MITGASVCGPWSKLENAANDAAFRAHRSPIDRRDKPRRLLASEMLPGPALGSRSWIEAGDWVPRKGLRLYGQGAPNQAVLEFAI